MADYSIKSHDRRPVIRARLYLSGGVLDLTSATQVDFVMRAANGGPVRVNAPATIIDAMGGVVEYQWAVGDTALAGKYQGEWEVHWAPDVSQTFPTLTYMSIDILADLDNDSEAVDA